MRFASFATIFAFIQASLVYTAPVEDPLHGFEVCSPSSDTMAVKTIDFAPASPKSGQTLSVTMGGELSKPIDKGAKIKVVAKKLGIPLYKVS